MASSTLQILIEAVDNASKVLRGIGGTAQDIGRSMRGVGAAMTLGVTAPIAAGMTLAAKSAMDFESAMVDVNRAVGASTSDEMDDMRRVVMKLSSEMGVMPVAMAAMVSEAGKLGVSRNQIEDYNRLVTQTGVAFDMSTDESGSAIAKLTNVMGYMDSQGRVNIDGLRRLNATIDYLGDSGATSQAAIVEVLGRAGGATRIFGLANTEAAAFATALLNMGDAPEVVGTAINGMLPKLLTASQQTDDFQEGLEALGLEAKAFERLIKQDASDALLLFMKQLSQTEDKAGILQKMFGTGSDAAIIAKLSQNYEALAKTMESAEDVDPTRLMASYEQQQATSAANMKKFQANVEQLKIAFGAVLLPAINDAIGALTPFLDKLTAFAEANPEVVGTIAKIGGAIALVGPALVWLGSIIEAVGTIAAAFGAGGAIGGLVTFLKGLATGAAGLGFILSGIVLLIFKLGAAATGLQLTFGETFSILKSMIAGIIPNLQQIPNAFTSMVNLVIAKFRFMGVSIRLAVAQAMQAAVATVRSIQGAMQAAGAAIVTAIARGITSRIGAIVSAARQVASVIARMVPGSPVETGPLTVLNRGYAGGQIAQMLADGITRGQNTLTAAMGTATSGATGAIGASPSGTTTGSTIASSAAPSVVININGAGDPRAVGAEAERRFAALMARYQQQQARVSYS